MVQLVEHNQAGNARPFQLDGAVHLWRVDLSAAGEAAWAVLMPDELERAHRFRFEHDRTHWVAARAGLRHIIGACTGRAPHALRFVYGTRGKPALAREPGDPDLRFNLSHSAALALVAVGVERELGVDLEAVRADRDVIAIAERVFSPLEQAMLAALPPELQLRGFYNAWSRKEAYVKALGEALWLELQSFDVSLAPGEPARLIATRPDPLDAQRWTLCDVELGVDYAAALAVQGSSCPPIVKHWP